MPGAAVGDVDGDRPVVARQLEADAAAVGRPAEGVREQVRDDLQHAVAVGDDHGRAVRLLRVLDAAAAGLLGEGRVGAVAEPAHVDLLGEDGEPVRVELGQIEDVVDEAAEPVGFVRDDLERLLGRFGVGDDALPQRGHVAADRGQRRAQLVGDGHQEVALELLGLREPGRHLAEPVGQMADLAAARHVGHLDVVVSLARPGRRRADSASTGFVIRRER